MIPKILSEEIHLEDGRKIILETGKLAKQADGSVVVKMGKCMLLATVVSSRTPSPVDFLPLTVDYRENLLLLEDFQVVFLNEKLVQVIKKF